MPGEEGPTGRLYIFDADGNKNYVKSLAFKNQEMDILNAERKAEDAYTDFYSMKWLGDNDGFYFIRQSRDLKRLDLCRVFHP